jgi:hypothetical protein
LQLKILILKVFTTSMFYNQHSIINITLSYETMNGKLPRSDKINFKISHSGGGVKLGPLGTSATSGLLYLPRVIVRLENLVEGTLAGETELFGESLPQLHFVHYKSHLKRPGLKPGQPRWEASD